MVNHAMVRVWSGELADRNENLVDDTVYSLFPSSPIHPSRDNNVPALSANSLLDRFTPLIDRSIQRYIAFAFHRFRIFPIKSFRKFSNGRIFKKL